MPVAKSTKADSQYVADVSRRTSFWFKLLELWPIVEIHSSHHIDKIIQTSTSPSLFIYNDSLRVSPQSVTDERLFLTVTLINMT